MYTRGVKEGIQLSLYATTLAKDVVVCTTVSEDIASGTRRVRGGHSFRHSQYIREDPAIGTHSNHILGCGHLHNSGRR